MEQVILTGPNFLKLTICELGSCQVLWPKNIISTGHNEPCGTHKNVLVTLFWNSKLCLGWLLQGFTFVLKHACQNMNCKTCNCNLPLNRSSRCRPTYQHAVSKLGNGVSVLIFNRLSISYVLQRINQVISADYHPALPNILTTIYSVKAGVQTSSASPHSGCGQSVQRKPDSQWESVLHWSNLCKKCTG